MTDLQHDVENFSGSSRVVVLAQLRLFGHPGFDGELVGEGTEAGDRLSGFRRRR